MKQLLPILLCLASTIHAQPRGTNARQQPPPLSVEEVQKRVPPDVKYIPDIPYREGNEAWKLDLAMPETPGGKTPTSDCIRSWGRLAPRG